MKHTLFTTTGVTDSDRLLHTPGEFAKKNLLYVQEVGTLKSLKPHKSQRENLDSYLIMAVISGEGTIAIKGAAHKIKKGECLFINCKESYSHESSETKPWELCWVHFNGINAAAYFELFYEQNAENNLFIPQNLKNFVDIMKKIRNVQNEKNMQAELQCGELLLQLLNFSLFTVMNKGKEKINDSKTCSKEIREYINEHYREKDLIFLLSQKFQMEKAELDSYFQKVYGISPESYVLNRRFNAAKELLRFTILPVDEIIGAAGMENKEVFQKLFLESEGMSAEEYRMKWSQWVK